MQQPTECSTPCRTIPADPLDLDCHAQVSFRVEAHTAPHYIPPHRYLTQLHTATTPHSTTHAGPHLAGEHHTQLRGCCTSRHHALSSHQDLSAQHPRELSLHAGLAQCRHSVVVRAQVSMGWRSSTVCACPTVVLLQSCTVLSVLKPQLGVEMSSECLVLLATS